MQIGVANLSASLSTTLVGQTTSGAYRDDGAVLYNFGGSPGNPGVSGLNDNIGVAVDPTAKKMWIRVNGGSWDGTTDNPATGVGGLDISGITGSIFAATDSNAFSYAVTAKFDSSSWSFSAPAGFGVLGH
jgi:hypothetical protein